MNEFRIKLHLQSQYPDWKQDINPDHLWLLPFVPRVGDDIAVDALPLTQEELALLGEYTLGHVQSVVFNKDDQGLYFSIILEME